MRQTIFYSFFLLYLTFCVRPVFSVPPKSTSAEVHLSKLLKDGMDKNFSSFAVKDSMPLRGRDDFIQNELKRSIAYSLQQLYPEKYKCKSGTGVKRRSRTKKQDDKFVVRKACKEKLKCSQANTEAVKRYIDTVDRPFRKLGKAVADCKTCKRFLDTSAHDVIVDETGNLSSVYFHDPKLFDPFFQPMAQRIKNKLESDQNISLVTSGVKEKVKTSSIVHINQCSAFKGVPKFEIDEINNVYGSFSGMLSNTSKDTVDLLLSTVESGSGLFSSGVTGVDELNYQLKTFRTVKQKLEGKNVAQQRNIIRHWMAKNPRALGVFHIKKTLAGFLLQKMEEENQSNWFTYVRGQKYPTDNLFSFLNENIEWFNEKRAEKAYKVKTGLPSQKQLAAAQSALASCENSLKRRFTRSESMTKQDKMKAVQWQLFNEGDEEANSFLGSVKTKGGKKQPDLNVKHCSVQDLIEHSQKAMSINVQLEPGETYPFASLTTSSNKGSSSLLAHGRHENLTKAHRELPQDWGVKTGSVSIDEIIKDPAEWSKESGSRYLLTIKGAHPQKPVAFDVDSSNLAAKHKQHEKVIGQLKEDSNYNISGTDSASGLLLSTKELVRFVFTLTDYQGKKNRYQINK